METLSLDRGQGTFESLKLGFKLDLQSVQLTGTDRNSELAHTLSKENRLQENGETKYYFVKWSN